MPGANCSIYGCSTSRKNKGIAIFRVPTGNDEYSKTWREKIVNIITRDREIDYSLRQQIEHRTLHTCELHYSDECLLRNPNKTTRIPGSLPTLNLPVKSISKPTSERPTTSIEKRTIVNKENETISHSDCYKSFQEFKVRIRKLKLPTEWEIKEQTDTIKIIKIDQEYVVPKYEILVQNSLAYDILVYNWLLPKTSILHITNKSNFKYITLTTLITQIESTKFCNGVTYKTDLIISHFVPKTYKHDSTCSFPLAKTEFFRPKECLVLCEKEKCKVCILKENQHCHYEKRKLDKLQEPAKVKAPV